MKDKRKDAVNSLIDGGVRFRLPAPFYLKGLKPAIKIRASKAGTILLFSKVVLKNNLEQKILENNTNSLVNSIDAVAECLAISALNGRVKIKLFKNIVKDYLLWQVDKRVLVEIFLLVSELNDGKDFINITKYFIRQMTMMMNLNLGQTESGR